MAIPGLLRSDLASFGTGLPAPMTATSPKPPLAAPTYPPPPTAASQAQVPLTAPKPAPLPGIPATSPTDLGLPKPPATGSAGGSPLVKPAATATSGLSGSVPSPVNLVKPPLVEGSQVIQGQPGGINLVKSTPTMGSQTLQPPAQPSIELAKPPLVEKTQEVAPAGSTTTVKVVKPEPEIKEQQVTPAQANVVTPDLASPHAAALADLAAVAKQMMSGDDPLYKATLNQAITTSSLMNQAERDALQMQINQDPSLRGQGAGLAYLQVMARDQGFNMDQMIGQLSIQSMDRIINMQKYGLEMGLKINDIQYGRGVDTYNRNTEASRYADSRADLAYDRNTAASHYKDSREDIAYARMQDIKAQKTATLKMLLETGQFSGAASTLQSMVDEIFPGSGIRIDEAAIKGRDPQALTQISQQLDFIKKLAATNPAAAMPIVQSWMNDPEKKVWFPEGMTADQIVTALNQGSINTNLVQSEGINKSINSLAVSGQSFDETGNSYAEYFRLTGRNAVTEGRKLTLETMNALRAGEGLPGFTQDSQGNFLDENGVPLDDEDFKDLAYRKDYADRVKKASEKPWEASYNTLLGTPGIGQKLLQPDLYPGANDAVKKVLAGITTGSGLFYQDPATGLWSVDVNKANISESNPELAPYFQNWPTAAFDAQGNVVVDAAGKPVYTPGGYVYGEVVNGKKILSTPEDEALDQAYFAYRNTGGKLNPTEWYFASQAGKATTPDPSKIPKGVGTQTGENFQTVGTTDGTKPITGTVSAAKLKVDEIANTFPTGVKPEWIRRQVDVAENGITQREAQTTIRDLSKWPGYKANVEYAYTQEGKDFVPFQDMLNYGLTEKQAYTILSSYYGTDRMNKAYEAMTGKKWVA